jgi:hypothetical protein
MLNRHDLPNFKVLPWSVDTQKLLHCFENFKATLDPVSNEYGPQYFSDNYEQMALTEMTDNKTIRGKIDERNYSRLLPEFKDTYLEKVLNNFKSPYTRVRLVSKKPGSYILPHMDYDSTYSVRYFIPLQTNPWAFTAIERDGQIEIQNLEAGKVHFVNVGFKHSAWNFGSENDIRLIVSVNGQLDLEDE